jgi:hypothetical protein
MGIITDDFMRQMISRTKTYTIVILKAEPNRNLPGVEKIVWGYGRRDFSLRKDGVLSYEIHECRSFPGGKCPIQFLDFFLLKGGGIGIWQI